MKRIGYVSRIVLLLFLAIWMGVQTPVTSYGENLNKSYISDIKLGYGIQGEYRLKSAGYTIMGDKKM